MKIALIVLNLFMVAMYGIDFIMTKSIRALLITAFEKIKKEDKNIGEMIKTKPTPEQLADIVIVLYGNHLRAIQYIKITLLLTALVSFFFLISAIDVAISYGR